MGSNTSNFCKYWTIAIIHFCAISVFHPAHNYCYFRNVTAVCLLMHLSASRLSNSLHFLFIMHGIELLNLYFTCIPNVSNLYVWA
ncbi:hypothetical protein FKM82_028867 [Ascaphus truei]